MPGRVARVGSHWAHLQDAFHKAHSMRNIGAKLNFDLSSLVPGAVSREATANNERAVPVGSFPYGARFRLELGS